MPEPWVANTPLAVACRNSPWAAWAGVFYFFLVEGPVRNAPERSWHASGAIFSPNRRFWIRFGPFLMILARTDIWAGLGQARDWPGGLGTSPGTGREALAQPILFFSVEIKKAGLFYFRRGVGYPPSENKKQTFLLFGGGQIPDRHFWRSQKCQILRQGSALSQ